MNFVACSWIWMMNRIVFSCLLFRNVCCSCIYGVVHCFYHQSWRHLVYIPNTMLACGVVSVLFRQSLLRVWMWWTLHISYFYSQVTFPFLSDIVFVRTWYPVSIPTFYNPVTSLLKPAGEKDTWSGMKTTGQLRYERGIKLKQNKDSLYKVCFWFVLFFKTSQNCSVSQTSANWEQYKYIFIHVHVWLQIFIRKAQSQHDLEIKQLRADSCGSVKIYKIICRVGVFSRSLLRLLL